MEVRWRPPPYDDIAGYKIYYSARLDRPLPEWQSDEISGPYDAHTVERLDPYSEYGFRVQAKLADQRYGDVSDIATLRVSGAGEFISQCAAARACALHAMFSTSVLALI